MAQAFVVTLEKPLPDPAPAAAYAKAATGRAIFRESERLASAARRKNVPAPTSLLSEDPAVLMAQMREEGFDPSKMRLPPEQWFDAAEAAAGLQTLIEFVTANLNDFKQPNPILRDLKAAVALLQAAAAAGVRFHFTKVNL